MPDIATITTFLGSIKTATELAKAIKGAGLSLEKAETKLKMAELISALADAKIQAAEIQDLIQEKDKRISELENLLKFKSSLYYENGVYLNKTDKDSSPYCSHCWEVNKLPIHLNFKKCIEIIDEVIDESRYTNLYVCPSCKNNVNYP